MSLEDLQTDVQDAYRELEEYDFLDRESQNELAMLAAATDADSGELLRRAVHMLFQGTADTGRLDFHLRSSYDVTYDEYLSGMTYEEMTEGMGYTHQSEDEDRRYQF